MFRACTARVLADLGLGAEEKDVVRPGDLRSAARRLEGLYAGWRRARDLRLAGLLAEWNADDAALVGRLRASLGEQRPASPHNVSLQERIERVESVTDAQRKVALMTLYRMRLAAEIRAARRLSPPAAPAARPEGDDEDLCLAMLDDSVEMATSDASTEDTDGRPQKTAFKPGMLGRVLPGGGAAVADARVLLSNLRKDWAALPRDTALTPKQRNDPAYWSLALVGTRPPPKKGSFTYGRTRKSSDVTSVVVLDPIADAPVSPLRQQRSQSAAALPGEVPAHLPSQRAQSVAGLAHAVPVGARGGAIEGFADAESSPAGEPPGASRWRPAPIVITTPTTSQLSFTLASDCDISPVFQGSPSRMRQRRRVSGAKKASTPTKATTPMSALTDAPAKPATHGDLTDFLPCPFSRTTALSSPKHLSPRANGLPLSSPRRQSASPVAQKSPRQAIRPLTRCGPKRGSLMPMPGQVSQRSLAICLSGERPPA
eukprot:TRINITY_DN11304_c0_g1_i1.p1 TRINITY_DN11304_c0_g1~~TRINITY_DN11304_c0_g1_i1.p1  ORF type:complete len:486 (+),score=80.47 TRINITY_DN11304_c0_g1_i1:52-1509(+)